MRAGRWRRRSVEWVEARLVSLAEWQGEHKGGVVFGLGVAIWVGLTAWFVVDWARGRVQGNAVQTGIGGLIGGAGLGLVASAVVALLAYVAVLLLNKLFQLLAPLVLFLPLVVFVPLYALGQVAIVLGKLLLLAPLFVLFVATRLIQLWRGIFYTCPGRGCAYRGLPAYVCPECAAPNRNLWPNLYGLLWHFCVDCDRRLPTLDLLGRRRLARRCGGCEVPLQGRHAGQARERLVAIVGGPGSGKTSYLLTTVNEILHADGGAIRGEIDDAEQAREYEREWRQLVSGLPPAKTSEVIRALLLYARIGGARCQLYLYDAPGEEFSSIASMSRQQYVPLLDGFILLVDPMSFEGVHVGAKRTVSRGMPLQEVVTSILMTAASGAPVGPNGQLRPRLAVVVSKADLDLVREAVGDRPSREACRQAIVRWAGENALRAVEHRFASVGYFACSPLGRSVDAQRGQPFRGSGVLEPLLWVLTGVRA